MRHVYSSAERQPACLVLLGRGRSCYPRLPRLFQLKDDADVNQETQDGGRISPDC